MSAPAQPSTVQCVTCPTLFEFDEEKKWAKQCYDCFKDDNTRRKCEHCGKARILATEENQWQKVCSKCFKESALLPCDGCKQPKIKAVEPWRQLCQDCWPKQNAS